MVLGEEEGPKIELVHEFRVSKLNQQELDVLTALEVFPVNRVEGVFVSGREFVGARWYLAFLEVCMISHDELPDRRPLDDLVLTSHLLNLLGLIRQGVC